EIKLTASGKANLAQEIIQVEELSGSLAEAPFIITGNLPLFQPQTTQPLSIVLGPDDIKLKGLYKGDIDANIEISRTVFNPIIRGNIALKSGRVSIPKLQEEEAENSEELQDELREVANNSKNKTVAQSKQLNQPQTNDLPINPTFQNFEVSLGPGFKFTRTLPRVNFRIAGDVTVNGGLNNLRGNGQIELKRGSLFILENSFFITRDKEQVVTFLPNRSLFNPQLDIELQTTVVDAPDFENLRTREESNSEIRDPIAAAANPEQVDVRIALDGQAEDLLASLGNTSSSGNACASYQRNILQSGFGNNVTNSDKKLRAIANCVNANSKVSIQTRDLLDNPAVKLASTPSRSNGEILSLLGNRTFAALQKLEQQLTGGNETELLESLVLDYIVAPLQTEITQDILYQAQKPVNSLGKSIGLTRLQVFPAFTGLKDINENSSARFIYDYEAGEFRVQYEARF
ncbi:MAG: translocation/assembly module TamB domain-containing protein, partial [Cyanobacteria bacterium P01_A01_bin.68]